MASAGPSVMLPPGLSFSSFAATVQPSPSGYAIERNELCVVDQIDEGLGDLR
jgi:hypothetical protein